MPFEKQSHELTKVKVANRPEKSRELSRAKSRIVQNESRELTKESRIVLGANLSSRELSRHLSNHLFTHLAVIVSRTSF